MFSLLTEIPNDCYLACSGGIDSMFALDFLLNARKSPSIIHFNHGTAHAIDAQAFVISECNRLGVAYTCHQISERDPKQSLEAYWSAERYKIMHSLKKPVLTAHHLQDVMEWWIFSSLHGKGKRIPVRNKNVLRPFLATSKSEIISWAKRKGIKFIDDPSNFSMDHMRNIIRHKILPVALEINPGLETVIRKMYL